MKQKIEVFAPLEASLSNNEALRSSIAALARTKPTFTRSEKIAPITFALRAQQLRAQPQNQDLPAASPALGKMHALHQRVAGLVTLS